MASILFCGPFDTHDCVISPLCKNGAGWDETKQKPPLTSCFVVSFNKEITKAVDPTVYVKVCRGFTCVSPACDQPPQLGEHLYRYKRVNVDVSFVIAMCYFY